MENDIVSFSVGKSPTLWVSRPRRNSEGNNAVLPAVGLNLLLGYAFVYFFTFALSSLIILSFDWNKFRSTSSNCGLLCTLACAPALAGMSCLYEEITRL